jgi:uncharacterized metal-binding protein YceD (DUF177 family)
MTQQHPEHPWHVPVSAQEVPQSGRHFKLAPDDKTRQAIAVLAELNALPRMTAAFEVTPYGRDGLRVVGTVSAHVVQACVVTLDPVENDVEEPVDIVFKPSVAPRLVEEDGKMVEIATEDEPEPLVDGTIDLGVIATEFLILGLDPYPRKDGAVFDTPPIGDEEALRPFAALAKLKKEQGGDDQ